MFKTNDYFEGNVKSIAFEGAEGPATIGAIAKGTYTFSTKTYEYMTVVSGKMDVLFPDDEEWVEVEELDTFEIPPGSEFSVRTKCDAAYVCVYRDEPLPEFEEDEEGEEGCGCGCGCDC